MDVLFVPNTPDTAVTFSAIAGSPAINVPVAVFPSDTPFEEDSKTDLITRGPNVPYVAHSLWSSGSFIIRSFSTNIYAKRYDEQTLSRVAYAFEQLSSFRNRLQPYQIPKTKLKSDKDDGPQEPKF